MAKSHPPLSPATGTQQHDFKFKSCISFAISDWKTQEPKTAQLQPVGWVEPLRNPSYALCEFDGFRFALLILRAYRFRTQSPAGVERVRNCGEVDAF
jgi:hypothetical protein